jgi:PAS domain S-box-containing protein
MAGRKRTPSVPPVSLTRLRFFEHLFYSAAAGAMIFDLEGRVTHVNPAAERLLGWESGELTGRPATEFVAPGSESILQRVLESGRSWSGVLPRRRKSGSVFPARGIVSTLPISADGLGSPA